MPIPPPVAGTRSHDGGCGQRSHVALVGGTLFIYRGGRVRRWDGTIQRQAQGPRAAVHGARPRPRPGSHSSTDVCPPPVATSTTRSGSGIHNGRDGTLPSRRDGQPTTPVRRAGRRRRGATPPRSAPPRDPARPATRTGEPASAGGGLPHPAPPLPPGRAAARSRPPADDSPPARGGVAGPAAPSHPPPPRPALLGGSHCPLTRALRPAQCSRKPGS